MPKTAGIILIGNEILSGKIADVNAAYLCRELRQLGVDVRRISVVPDEVELIAREVVAQSRDFDVVITSGGVGPTHDDVTIEGVARAMGVPVVRHPRLVATLEGYYRGELNDAHLKMAETRSEEHTSELQSRLHLVCRLLLEKKKKITVLHAHEVMC